MSRFSKGSKRSRRMVGQSKRLFLWSGVALVGMVLFSFLFTYPIQKKIKSLDEENILQEIWLKEWALLGRLDLQLTQILEINYAQIQATPLEAFDDEHLLELPAQIEKLAASAGVALVAINPRSVEDGAQVAIQATFQGDMKNLYDLLQEIGRVSYIGRLDSISILALSGAEQMELNFKVPIQ